MDLNVGIDFVPFAIETSSVWGDDAMRLVTKIARRTAVITHEPHGRQPYCVSESQ